MKIFAFCGLEHHYLKLKDIKEYLAYRGHEMHWLTADNSINIDPPSAYLIQRKEPFVHIYNYIAASQNIAADATTNMPDIITSGYFAPFWVSNSTFEMHAVYAGVTSLIQVEKPDAFLILHENNFWGRIIALVAKGYDIPCYSFQEGMLRKSDQDKWNKQGLAADNSSLLFCWSEHAKQQYLDAGIPEEKLFVSGPLHLDRYAEKNRQQSNIVVLALPLISHYKGNLAQDVSKLSSFCADSNLNLFVRFHPREVEYGHQLLDGIQYNRYDEYDPLPLIASAAVLLIQHSTIAIEAAGIGVPIIEFAPSATEEVEQSLSHVVPIISDYDQMNKLLPDNLVYIDDEWIFNHILVDGMARERVAMVIENEEN